MFFSASARTGEDERSTLSDEHQPLEFLEEAVMEIMWMERMRNCYYLALYLMLSSQASLVHAIAIALDMYPFYAQSSEMQTDAEITSHISEGKFQAM